MMQVLAISAQVMLVVALSVLAYGLWDRSNKLKRFEERARRAKAAGCTSTQEFFANLSKW